MVTLNSSTASAQTDVVSAASLSALTAAFNRLSTAIEGELFSTQMTSSTDSYQPTSSDRCPIPRIAGGGHS